MRMVGDGVGELIARAVAPGNEELIPDLARRFRQRYYAFPVLATRPFPGVASTLGALGPRPKAVATNKPGDLARTILERLHHRVRDQLGDQGRERIDHRRNDLGH